MLSFIYLTHSTVYYQNMENYIFLGGCALFAFLFPIAFIYAIILTVRRNKCHKALKAFMVKAGFQEIMETNNLNAAGIGIPGNVTKAMSLEYQGRRILWIEKKVKMTNPGEPGPSRMETRREFHFQLKRSAPRKIVIAFAQKNTPAFVKSLVTKLLDFATGDSMTHIEIPHDLRDSGMLAALAETGNDSLYNLIDRETIDMALSAPSNCIVMFYAENETAVIGYDFESRTVEPAEFWALMKKIMRLPADI